MEMHKFTVYVSRIRLPNFFILVKKKKEIKIRKKIQQNQNKIK